MQNERWLLLGGHNPLTMADICRQLPRVTIDFYLPHQVRLNPELDAARENLIAWARRLGMLDPVPGMPRAAAWTERDLFRLRLRAVRRGIAPEAPADELDLAAAWLAGGT
jgi:germacradienol/geosmin synthase